MSFKQEYINLELTFNEAMYLTRVLKETRTDYSNSNDLLNLKWPLKESKYMWAGTSVFEKTNARDMLATLKFVLEIGIEQYLQIHKETNGGLPVVYKGDKT